MDRDRWARRLSGTFTFVAVEGGEVVGFGNLEADGHLDCLYTHAHYQGQGVGTALVAAMEAKARELGLTRLFTEASITARPFFERRAFRVLQPQQVECRGSWFTNYRMDKPLELSPAVAD